MGWVTGKTGQMIVSNISDSAFAYIDHFAGAGKMIEHNTGFKAITCRINKPDRGRKD
jgi:hypothetical protein